MERFQTGKSGRVMIHFVKLHIEIKLLIFRGYYFYFHAPQCNHLETPSALISQMKFPEKLILKKGRKELVAENKIKLHICVRIWSCSVRSDNLLESNFFFFKTVDLHHTFYLSKEILISRSNHFWLICFLFIQGILCSMMKSSLQ